MNRVEHTLEPVYNSDSDTLILGSMPSIKSRKIGKYYGHKSNRFWSLMEVIYDEKIDDWKSFILNHNLALWDVIESCDIQSSSDTSIKNVVVNDIKSIIDSTKIDRIFLLGRIAFDLYYKYVYPNTKIEGIYLPSSSSANASFSFEELVKEYSKIKK